MYIGRYGVTLRVSNSLSRGVCAVFCTMPKIGGKKETRIRYRPRIGKNTEKKKKEDGESGTRAGSRVE
jgi:hypothetical protein